MEHRLRLVKGLSYSGAVCATRNDPYVVVEDGERYRAAMASGYFEEAPAEAPMRQGAGPEEGMGMPPDGFVQEIPAPPQAAMGEQAQAEAPMQQGADTGESGQDGAETGTPIGRMTLDELKAYALVGGIDISGLRKKDDILAAVKVAEEKAAEAREALRIG